MYYLWFLVIAAVILLVLTIVHILLLFVIDDAKKNKHNKLRAEKMEEYNNDVVERKLPWWSSRYYMPEYIAIHEKGKDGIGLIGWLPIQALSLVIIGIFFTLFAIFNPIWANREYLEFENLRQVVLAQNGTNFENFQLTQKIIDVNNWLVKAKASNMQWGNWSMYYQINFDEVEPIVVR